MTVSIRFANRSPLDPADLDSTHDQLEAMTDAVGEDITTLVQQDASINNALTALENICTALTNRVTVLEAAGTPPGVTPPTITTDPTVAFPGGTGDVNETYTITAGTVGGGANTGITYQPVIDGIRQGSPSPNLTGALLSAWFSGSRLFRVLQIASWTNGPAVERSSPTYTLNAIAAVPGTTGTGTARPSMTPVPSTFLMLRGHGTYTNGPIIDYGGHFTVNTIAGPVGVACTISNASPAVVTQTAHGRVAGIAFEFGTTGALPTGAVVGDTYYVLSTGLTADAHQFSATVGGAAINTSSAGSGTHNALTVTLDSALYPGAQAPGITYRERPRNATGQAVTYAESDPVTVPGTAPTATLVVAYSTDDSESTINLATEGVKDWKLFSDGTQEQAKSGGVGSIVLAALGGTLYHTTGSSNRDKTWTGGTPTGSGTADGGRTGFNSTTTDTFTITLPAGTTDSDAHKLRLWATTTLRVSASWSDSSAAVAAFDYVSSQKSTITFTGIPGSASANLVITVQNVGTQSQGIVFESMSVYAATGGGGGGGSGVTPSPTDFIHADIPFAQMTGTVQLCGSFPSLSSIPETTGFTRAGNVLGSPMRFGKVTDPVGTRKVFRQAMRIDDPQTSGQVIRVDVQHTNRTVAVGTIYWACDELFIPSTVYFSNDKHQLAAVHPPDGSSAGASGGNLQLNMGLPRMTLLRGGTGTFVQYTGTQANLPPDTWVKIVHRFRISPNSDGFHTIWINGAQVFTDTGSNGIAQSGHYWKGAAFYQIPGPSWTDTSRPEQVLFRRSMSRPFVDVGQTESQIRALLT